MLILGPAAGPRISAVTSYPPSSARSLITCPPSTISTAGSVTVEPTSPASLSIVRTSSTDALSCLPPQRTIAYTKNSLLLVPACRGNRGETPKIKHRGGRVCQQGGSLADKRPSTPTIN